MLEILEDVHEQIELIEDPWEKVALLNLVAGKLWKTDPQLGIEQAVKALSIANDNGLDLLASSVMITLGDLYCEIGDFDQSLVYLNQGLDISQKNKDKELEISALMSITMTQQARGKFERALSLRENSQDVEGGPPIASFGSDRSMVRSIGIKESERLDFILKLDRYQAILEDQTEYIVRWLPNGTITFANDAYCRRLGLSKNQIIGTYVNPSDIEGDREWVNNRINAISPQKPIVTDINRVLDEDGSMYWEEWTDRGIFGEKHKLIEIQSVGRDITERKLAEDALAESEERFQLLANATFEGIAITDRGRFVDANDQLAKMFGYERDDLIELNVKDLVAPESWDLVRKNIETGFDQPYEHIALRRDGSRFHVEVHGRTIPYSGRILRVTAIRDVSQRILADQAIRNSETRFRSLVEHTSESLFCYEYDPPISTASPLNEQLKRLYDGVLVECNDVAARSYGYEHSNEVIGKRLTDLFGMSPSGLDDFFTAFIENAYQISNAEATETRDDGTERFFLNNGAGVIEDGKLIRIWGSFRDITPIKQAEIELRASEERYRSLIENLPVPLLIHSEGKVLFANPATVHVLGLTHPDDFIGRSAWDFVPPDLKDEFAHRFDTLYERRIPIHMQELRLLKAEGTELDVEIIATPVEYSGKPAAQSIILDITDRKRSEVVIRQSELRYRTLFENATDAIFLTKGEMVVDCNPIAEEKLGVPKDEIVGKTPFDFSPPTQPNGRYSREMGERIFEQVLNGEPQYFEWVHQRPDGKQIDVEINLDRVEIDDDVFLLAIWRDLTERKRAEEAAQEERQRLARDLHDAVSQTLWSSTLIADVLPDLWEQDKEQGLDRLMRLRDLTRGAQAEMRALLLELRPSALIETEFEDLMRRLTEATAIRTSAEIVLEVEGSCVLPSNVHVGLYRIAQEALNNAARHAVAGKILCQLQCDPEYVKLEISDDGSGFDSSSISTGQHLGLKIMRERSESIGAQIEIVSQPGQGTSVHVRWSGNEGAT